MKKILAGIVVGYALTKLFCNLENEKLAVHEVDRLLDTAGLPSNSSNIMARVALKTALYKKGCMESGDVTKWQTKSMGSKLR